MPLSQLRKQMALVQQDILLFGGTIRENIAYGKPSATPAEIENAARQAHAYEFISGFPEGYDTVVGDRGIKLSEDNASVSLSPGHSKGPGHTAARRSYQLPGLRFRAIGPGGPGQPDEAIGLLLSSLTGFLLSVMR